MTNQTLASSSELQSAISRFETNMKRLDELIDQLGRTLKREFEAQLSPDIQVAVRELRRDSVTITRAVAQSAAKIYQLEELVRTFALITSSLEPDQVLEEVMDTVINLTDAERGYLMLLDEATGEFAIRTSRNRGRRTLSDEDVIFSRSIAHAAIESGQAIITSNAQSDPRFQGMQSVSVNNLRSIVAVPLTLRERVIGVLYADNPITQGVFTADLAPILQAFTAQAAIAIDNAQRFSLVKADLHRAQQEVQELRIMIDERKKEQQVKAITETQYFQELEAMARSLRRKHRPDTEESSG